MRVQRRAQREEGSDGGSESSASVAFLRQALAWVVSGKRTTTIIYPALGASWVALLLKTPLANTGDLRHAGSIPRSGRSPGGGRDNPVQYSCLENPMDTGTWWATVHATTELDTTE